MKQFKYLLIILTIHSIGVSCSKQGSVSPTPVSSVTVVNAVVGSNPMIANFTAGISPSTYYPTTLQIGFGAYGEYSVPSGIAPVSVFQVSDTVNPAYQGSIKLQPHAIYSLFLSGVQTGRNQSDTLLTVDNLPYYPVSDSMSGVRFVNLAIGAPSISVNIQGNLPTQAEFSNLGYRQISSFKSYSATSSVGGFYNFEIRSQVNDSLLTTFAWTYGIFQTSTIVVCGQESTGLTVFQVNYY